QSIGQSGLAVIDVRDDAEIARVLDTHEARKLCERSESSTSVIALVFWARRLKLCSRVLQLGNCLSCS
ncbi:MAG TPA: hypothetical protein VJR49_02520, partial [Chthoniobacterales bacterium]|nr:hypothetical protein [Chthoniobacterales bacterium]